MSIYSFPDRGPWGDSKYRGNCSGHVYKELYEQLKPGSVCDPMMGSGTSIEVAQEMNIKAFGLDLRLGFDILRESIVERIGQEVELCLSHPAYGGQIKFSGEVWGDPHPSDLSRCKDDNDFHEKLHIAMLNQRTATVPGGIYGAILGDWRRNGKYTSYQAELIARMPSDELAAVLIKAQHNTTSARRSYGAMRFPFISHEYVLLFQKPKKVLSMLTDLASMARQQSTRLTSTWKAIVRSVLMGLGGSASLSEIYAKVAEHAPDRLAANPSWQAKVRQTLNSNLDCFAPVDRGVWKLAA
ncbi:hypothetical protein [Acidovorax sp. sic0104]|uniref:hypothetical protein n=1 Tax=Acidovorax sp. sic0104 TaxID=2854784 RepID=UPI001C437540|nr:hypothetical protein [Acidovorax sp. sic0104]MBV7541929.1 hypothetical protein [Acidovorax sp. sic0104]